MATVTMATPAHVIIPMSMHIGAPAEPVVKKGDQVCVGTLIGKAGGFVSANIYSSVSGTVEGVAPFRMVNGSTCQAVAIAADGQQTVDPACVPPVVTDKKSLMAAVQACGLVGLGGAGFPTHVKLAAEGIDTLLINAAELTRTGIGLPAYYNDEVIIPSLESRGLSLQDARDYNIIGCVEPQKAGKTNGWHDAAFFNMCRPLELVFSNGKDKGVQIGPKTGNVEDMKTFDEFYDAYKAQMEYAIALLVNADNAIDMAHAERAPLPFLACMVDDCIKRGKTLEQGGAVYNFTGPQGFGVANMADSLYAVKKLVYDEKKITMHELKEALNTNYGKGLNQEDITAVVSEVAAGLKAAGQAVGEKEVAAILKAVVAATESEQVKANGERILKLIDEVPKFGNDIPEVDAFARDVAYTYTRPMEKYKNPRGGMFQAGLYPVSANVPLGAQTGATPDGRLSHMPVADGVSPSAGKDVNGPTAAANSVSRLDHFIASNGTLFNQKFHPSALSGRQGLEKFVGLIQSYFDQKGSHMQFNVVSRETLLDAQKHPEQYKHLVVRVAGYSALFTTLSKSLQDDIIRRTEQGF